METRARIIAFVLIAVIALLFLGWQSTHLRGPGTGYDEGVYLASAHSLATGHAPYKALFFSKPPLFAVLLDGVGRVSDWHLAGYRLAMALFALATLLITSALAWRWRGPWPAVATAALLAISPKFVFYARPLGSDTPVIALMMLCLLAGSVAIEWQSRWAWAVAGGAAIAAVGMKPNGGLIIPIIFVSFLWWLRQRPRNARMPAVLCALFSIVGVVPVLLIMLPFSLQPHAYMQSITYELSGRGVYPLDPAGNIRHIIPFILLDHGLVVLAAIGLVLALRRPLSLVPVLLVVWLVLGGGFLVSHTPLFSHHIPILLPPLAIFAGTGFVALIARIVVLIEALKARQPLSLWAWATSALSALTLCGVVALIPHLAAINHESAQRVRSASERQFATALEQYVPPGALVITDDQFSAFSAHLPVGPWFADTSTYRIDSGYLTSAEAIAKTEEEEPAAIIVASDKFRRLTEYVAWVQGRYDPIWSDGSRTIYKAR
ncbi:MAG: glycosyltransferase family 39 protein [Chloroflexota bacterium]|nr:glycosyltransferase family 39 protein [Chloroflexota bacterium]